MKIFKLTVLWVFGVLLFSAPMLMLNGCGETSTGDTYNVTSGGDTHIGDSTTISEQDAEDVEQGVYREDYSQGSCEEAGYFYCDIDSQCLDVPLNEGSCG